MENGQSTLIGTDASPPKHLCHNIQWTMRRMSAVMDEGGQRDAQCTHASLRRAK